MEKCVFETFMCKRDDLIDQLEAGDLTKADYILRNYEIFVEGVTPPSLSIQTVKNGIIAYHYYNTMAKKLMMDGSDNYFRDPHRAKKYHNKGQDQYVKKDSLVLSIIELLAYENMEAYFVTLASENLQEQLFEIVLTNYRRVIFHSKDKRILNRLRKNGVFSEIPRTSKINDYVNTKYCE